MILITKTPGIILWHVVMSVDGYIAGAGRALGWIFRHQRANPAVKDVIRTTGTVLMGRRSYEAGKRPGNPPSAGKVCAGSWIGPQFVLTHRVPPAEEDPTVTFLSDDIGGAVARAREEARGKNVVLIGATVARQALDAGLVDKILVYLSPVLLSDGVRLFGRPGSGRVRLERLGATSAGLLTNLCFKIEKGETA